MDRKAYRILKYKTRRVGISHTFLLYFLTIQSSYSQLSAPIPPKPDYENSVSAGVSYGFQNNRDAEFYGWTLEYSRSVGNGVIVSGALAWDRESEKLNNQQDKIKDSYTLVGTIGYSLNSFLTVAAGLGKGVADNDNKDNSMKLNNGDNHAGVILGTVIPVFPDDSLYSLGLSVAYEYNISQKESDYSFDLGIGRSF